MAILLVVILTAAAALIAIRWCSGAPGKGTECLFTVERGWGARRISEALADSGLIRCPLYFLWKYSRLQAELPLQAGCYLLDDGMLPESIIVLISRGEVVPVPTHWVTIPPGLRLEEVLQVLSEDLERPIAALDSIASDRDFLDGLGLSTLEGRLAPETYEFADSLDVSQVILRILATGSSAMPVGWEQRADSLGLSPDELYILASIVEREGMVDEERLLIAGVFLTRLRMGMNLESCATVQYALGEVHGVLLYRDLETDSPYNTYIYTGLPPGPICSPGQASLDAVLDPDTTEGYVYFVSRGDGTGLHLFATTYSGHLANGRRVSSGNVD